ncbi:MAG: hypothetical protein HGA55_07620 [Methanoregulaceae archaeon]|nr:hypothetical protein [Methanoregulaceae archaeon]
MRTLGLLAHSAGLFDCDWLDPRVTAGEPRTNSSHLALVAREGGTLIGLEQERAAPDLSLSMISVTLELEVRGHQHQEKLLRVLGDAGYRIRPLMPPRDISHGFYHAIESDDTE